MEINANGEVYLIEDSSMCQVELSMEDWEELTDGDTTSGWEALQEVASLSSDDSPDIVFYIGAEHLEYLKASNVFTPKVLDILRQCKLAGYEYCKFY